MNNLVNNRICSISVRERASTAILGVSHLVMGCEDATSLGGHLKARGFIRAGQAKAAPNPREKMCFALSPFSETHDLELWESKKPSPPIELVQATRPRPVHMSSITPMRVYIGDKVDDYDVITKAEPGLTGIVDLGGDEPRAAVVTIRTSTLKETASFWEVLGAEIIPLDEKVKEVRVHSILEKAKITIFLVSDPAWSGKGYLDGVGALCPALICRNAGSLRQTLLEKGHEVSAIFEYSPFGRSLKLFFARANSGELFEFLSASGN